MINNDKDAKSDQNQKSRTAVGCGHTGEQRIKEADAAACRLGLTSLLFSSSDCYLELLLIQYLTNSTNLPNSETEMLSNLIVFHFNLNVRS